MPRGRVGWILSGALLGAVIVVTAGRVTNTTPAAPKPAPTATLPYGTITSDSYGGSPWEASQCRVLSSPVDARFEALDERGVGAINEKRGGR